MTRMKGFKKNRFELPEPVLYEVEMELGTVEVMATSARDAQHKTEHLQINLGFFKGAHKITKNDIQNS